MAHVILRSYTLRRVIFPDSYNVFAPVSKFVNFSFYLHRYIMNYNDLYLRLSY